MVDTLACPPARRACAGAVETVLHAMGLPSLAALRTPASFSSWIRPAMKRCCTASPGSPRRLGTLVLGDCIRHLRGQHRLRHGGRDSRPSAIAAEGLSCMLSKGGA